MAITYVGGQTASITVASAATQTITYALTGGSDAVPAAGDLVIIGYGEGAGGDATLSGRISTSGYSLITELFAADTNNSNLAVFTKFMGVTPDSNVVVVGSTTSNAAATVNIQVWRGVNTTTPLSPTTTTATGSNSGNADPAAITPTYSGNVIAIFANSASATANTATFTAASTSYMTDFRQVARAGGVYRGLGGQGYVTGRSAGVSYNPAAWALSADSTAFAWTAATLALSPGATNVSVSPTGVAAAGSVGSVSVTSTEMVSVSVTGVEAAGQIGYASGAGSSPVSVTGVSASGQIEAVSVATVTPVSVTGVQADGQVGSVSVANNIFVYLTGVQADGSIGQVIIASPVSVSVTGVQASGQVGMVRVRLGGTVKVWNGFWWQNYPVKVWNGTAWVIKPVRVWDGTGWA